MDAGERYVLGRLIGEGATACVYEAEDTVLRREVAVKVFRNVDIGDSTSERIDEETRILASLSHPHLLPVFDSGRNAEGHRFIVMPLVRGTTLAQLLNRGPIAPREVKQIGTALAGALAYIHEQGIVHRDVKPSNVLLAEDGTPYLADFGFAHSVDGPALTATDCIVGTAGYLAPEQAEGLPVTPAVDVYALGLVLLEALTAERAYRGTPLERATANALRPPHIPALLGPGWLRVLRTLTARTPSVRPAAGGVAALLAAGEDELPEVTAFDGTMELSGVSSWSRPSSAVGVGVAGPVAVSGPGPVSVAVPVPVSVGGSSSGVAATVNGHPSVVPASAVPRHARRRVAALGAVAATALTVVGVGANMLTSGASADMYSPSQPTPGVGAGAGAGAGAGPTSHSPAASAPVSSPVTVTVVNPGANPGSNPGGAASPADHRVSPPPPAASTTTKCQGGPGPKGNGNGDGHGKHKCGGDG